MQDARRTISGHTHTGKTRGKRLRSAVSIVLAAIASAVPCARAASPNVATRITHATPADVPGEIVVRLYPTAAVNGDEVTLADVAEIEGESAQLIGSWQMTAAPHPGDTGLIELVQIQNMLARRGVNLSHWVFRGSTRCTITRSGPAAKPSVPQQVTATTRPSQEQAGASTRPAEAKTDPNTLEGTLREHIAQRLASFGGTPVIRFSPAIARVLRLSRPMYAFQIKDRGDRALGMVPMEVAIFERDQLKQTIPVLADISLAKSVAVTVRPINRGETIRADALKLEERIFDKADEIGMSELAQLIGQRVKRFIDQKAVVYSRDIEPVPLVTRNDLVTVIVRRGGLMIRGSAKAMSSAGIGESVTLKNEGSKETFSAIVTGEKTVELQSNILPLPAPGSQTQTLVQGAH